MISALAAALFAAASPAPALVLADAASGAPLAPGSSLFSKEGEPRGLRLVVLANGGCLSATPSTLEGRACKPLPEEAVRSIRWFAAVPVPLDYDNARRCSVADLGRGCHEPIRYRRLPLPVLAATGTVEVSQVEPLRRAGTHRIAAELELDGQRVSSAPLASGAAEQLDEAAVAGMVSLVVRRGDGYVGLLAEQLGTPFVFYPVQLPSAQHQTDARLGADCVALVIYGRRRMGESVPYVAPAALRELTDLVAKAHARREGGRPAVWVLEPHLPVAEGDVLHFGFQTAVLSRDLPPLGQLDERDLVIHTYHRSAEEVPLAALPYRFVPLEIRRFR